MSSTDEALDNRACLNGVVGFAATAGHLVTACAGIIALLMSVAGCGAGESEAVESPNTLSWSGPAFTVDPAALDHAESEVSAALLNEANVPINVSKVVDFVDRTGGRLQHACGASTESDQYTIAESGRTWSGDAGQPTVDQLAVAYHRNIAVKAVQEADEALNCSSYRGQTGTVRFLGRLDALSVSTVDVRSFGFCEIIDGKDPIAVCTVIAGSGNVACNARVWSAERQGAEMLITALAPQVRSTCTGQRYSPSDSRP